LATSEKQLIVIIFQLTKELISGSTFVGWKEGLINFPPTYKYERNSSRYVGEIHNEAEKKRSPAWLCLFLIILYFCTASAHVLDF